VIEAQAMGRPVVVTDQGGTAETVDHGVTGWRVPPGDVGALARTLDEMLALTPPEREALGARARASVCAHYTTEAMQKATLDVYRELLA
jgi:glycosyltransferase involved in cell wall biosynthesis